MILIALSIKKRATTFGAIGSGLCILKGHTVGLLTGITSFSFASMVLTVIDYKRFVTLSAIIISPKKACEGGASMIMLLVFNEYQLFMFRFGLSVENELIPQFSINDNQLIL